jgi:hypothetical protein
MSKAASTRRNLLAVGFAISAVAGAIFFTYKDPAKNWAASCSFGIGAGGFVFWVIYRVCWLVARATKKP